MDTQLTKDAEFMILSLYKVYLERIRDGNLKRKAVEFMDFNYLQSELFPTWPMPDIVSTAAELNGTGYIKKYQNHGGIVLLPAGIAYCENAYGFSISEVVGSFLKLKSLLFPS